MPTRIRVVIAFAAGLAMISILVPLISNIVRAGSRPQIVITIPSDAAHSPLPYSTRFPNVKPGLSSNAFSAAIPSQAQSAPFAQTPEVKFKKPGDGHVDINTASLTDLERLPGIGPAMGSRILTERSALGRFRKASDLLEVRGIGEKKYARMEPFVVIQ